MEKGRMTWTCWRTFASAFVTLSLVSGGCGSGKGSQGSGGASGSSGMAGAGGVAGTTGTGGAAGTSGGAGAAGVAGVAGTGGAAGTSGGAGAAGTGGTSGAAGGGGTGGATGTAGAGGGLTWPGTRILGTATFDYLAAMVVDASGNIFISGTTGGALYGQIQGVTYDMFALKLNAAGAVEWTAQIAGDGYESGSDLALDGAGNVYVCGSTYTSIDGDAGAGGVDVVLAKFDSTGARQWIRQFGSAGDDHGAAVKTDAAGNVYVAGSAGGALPGNSTGGFDDVFLAKFDSDGTQLWARQFGAATSESVTGAAIDGTGNIYVSGYVTDPANAPPSAPEAPQGFLAKYDGAGTPQWTRALSSDAREKSNGVATDAAGNVYVVGSTSGDVGGIANAGYDDGYVIKYDGAGNRVWARQLGSAVEDSAEAVATDGAGNVYVAGATYDAFATNPAWGAFVAKYDSAGTGAWISQRPMNGTSALAVAPDPRGDVFIAGTCNTSLDGQPALGITDIFVMKFSRDGVKY